MTFVRLGSLLLSSVCLWAGQPQPEAPPATSGQAQVTPEASPMGGPSDPDRFWNLPRLLLDDTTHVVTTPARWERPDWTTAGVSVAAVLGAGLLLDHAGDRFMVNHANASWDRGAKAVQELGGVPSVLIAGGTYLAGVAFKEPEVRATGIDAMVTMGIAQLLLTLPLKTLVGRSRPEAGRGDHDFHPLHGGASFPSGHATQAFALASVISEHADRPWVTGLSYGLACLVGVARVEQRKHFVSDVVAGGLIGTFVGKSVVSYNQSLRSRAHSKVALSFAPTVQPGGYGFSVAMVF